ncbi:MAG TPA: Hpt domain-containing protein [Leptospiraceae bacterium]|nr:Hpt domain-containing protein [Leptospiraceae bacterium]
MATLASIRKYLYPARYQLAAVLAAAVFLSALAIWKYRQDMQGALHNYRLEAHDEALRVARNANDMFRLIYQGLRTIARLPGVRKIQDQNLVFRGGGAGFEADAKLAVQELYNNLATNVAISEVYIAPRDLDPDAPAYSNAHKEPLVTFDELIVGQTALGNKGDNAESVPEIELYEYRLMKKQIEYFRAKTPRIGMIQELDFPARSGQEVVTCDNSHYNPKKPDDKDRSGFVYSVPFFDASGEMGGIVVAVMLTSAAADSLPSGNFALRNTTYNYTIEHAKPGETRSSHAFLEKGEANPDLLYSEVLKLDIRDDEAPWMLWAGLPNEMFTSRTEVRDARVFVTGALGFIWILASAAVLLILSTRRNRAILETQNETLETLVGERTADLNESRGQMRDILQNVSQGILTISRDRTVNSEYSGSIPQILGLDPSGKPFVELFGEPLLKERVSKFIHALFDNPFMGADMFDSANPLRSIVYFTPERKVAHTLSFGFARIWKDKAVDKILVIIDDRTREAELERAVKDREKEQSSRVEKLYQILNLEPEVFRSFVTESLESLGFIRRRVEETLQGGKAEETLRGALRDLHTVKGNARALNLDSIAQRAHAVEEDIGKMVEGSAFEPSQLEAILLEIDSVVEEISDGENLFGRILGMKDLIQVRTVDALAELEERSHRLIEKEALDSGKSANLEFHSNGTRLRSEILMRVRNALTHLLRNAIAHGIEGHEERRAAGKTLDGRISVEIKEVEDQILVVCEDDGRGIDPEELARAAVSKEAGMAGVNAYIEKPVRGNVLWDKIAPFIQ